MQNGESDLFNIGPNRLDSEWLLQPRHYRREAEKLADVRKAYEMAKADRDVSLAEMSQKVRTNPGVYGLEKVTEAAVNEVVTMHTRKAEQSVIEAKHALDIQQSMIDALDQRKYALQDMVRLRLASYYADPKMPEGVPPQAIAAAMERQAPKLTGRKAGPMKHSK